MDRNVRAVGCTCRSSDLGVIFRHTYLKCTEQIGCGDNGLQIGQLPAGTYPHSVTEAEEGIRMRLAYCAIRLQPPARIE
eukprot:scaffold91482_cov33-Tisochrysis_lutea.AAC.2